MMCSFLSVKTKLTGLLARTRPFIPAYPASRGYIFAVLAGVRKVLFARQLLQRKCSLCSQGNSRLDFELNILFRARNVTGNFEKLANHVPPIYKRHLSQEIRRCGGNSFFSEKRGGPGSSAWKMCNFKSSVGEPHSRNEGSTSAKTIKFIDGLKS